MKKVLPGLRALNQAPVRLLSPSYKNRPGKRFSRRTMGKLHIVAQGEFLSSIARLYGFASYKTIWDASENQEIKDKRKNPNILLPGDRLFIPDKETKDETRGSDKKHRFELQGEPIKLRIALMGLKNEPLAGHECVFIVEGETDELTTKADGILEQTISDKAKAGKILDRGKPGSGPPTEITIPLKIGHLDPADQISGQIGRLNNLGYNAGDVPDHVLTAGEEEKIKKSPQFLSAVEEFQCDFAMLVDGICGANTQAKLIKVHGC
jgi:hypothetical protein